ncbi:MAG: 3-isopropylmalate dehydratase large subunit [Promethearchaeota archaeon CR_4]|nr:MAG: 3-isopropylmalate dehydratase large subunit [Candidatus Lokiarchaeota archaeon CR_4]
MGQTISEKILAAHSKDKAVTQGNYILCNVDLALTNDITSPISIDVFDEIVGSSGKTVFDPGKIALIPDHFTPNKDIKSAQQAQKMREFAKKHHIQHYYEVGRCGIEHCFLPEQGIVLPGDLVIGADSHTCTYGALGAFSTGMGSTDIGVAMVLGEAWFKVPETIKFVYTGKLPKFVSGKDLILHTIGQVGVDGANYCAMEFCGEAIERLSMDGRLTMCNMAIEAGAKNGIVPPDEITRTYVDKRAKRAYKFFKSDPDATYKDTVTIDVSTLELQVAYPHLPSNARNISTAEAEHISVDQVVIGSCTNGRMEDLATAAQIFKGRHVHPDVRCIVIPGTQEIYLDAISQGYIEQFVRAGAIVSTPTCGPCLGGHMGILGKGEVAVSTTNRNFVGRMGHVESKIYLVGPAIAAATALKGYICGPGTVQKTS